MSLSVLFKYSLHFGKKEKYAFYQLSFRYGVSFKNISGESKSVTEEMTAPWTETIPLSFTKHIQCRRIRTFLPMFSK